MLQILIESNCYLYGISDHIPIASEVKLDVSETLKEVNESLDKITSCISYPVAICKSTGQVKKLELYTGQVKSTELFIGHVYRM